MTPEVQYLKETETYTVFKYDAFAILVWKQAPNLEGVSRLGELFRLVRKSLNGQKFGYLAIVEEVAGRNMDAEVRKALSMTHKEFEANIAGAAIVFEGTGFRASIVRSVVSAIDFASRMAFPSKVESNVLSGATWLRQRVGSVPAQTLASVVNRVRHHDQAARE